LELRRKNLEFFFFKTKFGVFLLIINNPEMLGQEFQKVLRSWGKIPFRKAFLSETEKLEKGVAALDAILSLFLTADGQKERFLLWWRVNLSPEQRNSLLQTCKNHCLPRSTFEFLHLPSASASASSSITIPSSSSTPSSALWNCMMGLLPEIRSTEELSSGEGSGFLRLFLETVDDFIERSLKSRNITNLEEDEEPLPRPRLVALQCAEKEVEALKKSNKKSGLGTEPTIGK
jgi:hypothetical protein